MCGRPLSNLRYVSLHLFPGEVSKPVQNLSKVSSSFGRRLATTMLCAMCPEQPLLCAQAMSRVTSLVLCAAVFSPRHVDNKEAMKINIARRNQTVECLLDFLYTALSQIDGKQLPGGDMSERRIVFFMWSGTKLLSFTVVNVMADITHANQ